MSNRRAVACVNACAGLNPAAIPSLIAAVEVYQAAENQRMVMQPPGDGYLDFLTQTLLPAKLELFAALAAVRRES